MSRRLYESAAFNAIAASGTTSPLKTPVLDMGENGGFEGVAFIAAATVTSTANILKARVGTASASAGLSDTTGHVDHTVGGLYLDIFRPVARYVQGVFTASGASSPSRAITAIRYGARYQPTTMDPSTMTGLALASPVTGTATG